MRISSPTDLKQLKKGAADNEPGAGMSDWAAKQIAAALEDSGAAVNRSPGKRGEGPKLAAAPRSVKGESKGEASVRLALHAAFGDWHRGGEVVQELIPFRTRQFRCDFALPRFRIYIEVDGWSGHGEKLEDHHKDRERGLFFSSYDWLPFRVSHAQAINSPGMLVDALALAIQVRQPVERDAIHLEPVEHKHGVWYRLRSSG